MPGAFRWSAATRAALAFGIPAAILTVAGHAELAVAVTLGSFSVMFGEGRPYRVRGVIVALAGIGFISAALVGAAVGHSGAPSIVDVVVLTAVACTATFVVDAIRFGPPGSFFFVMICGVAMLLARHGISIGQIVACAVIGSASSVLVSMAGAMRDATRPETTVTNAAVKAVEVFVTRGEAETLTDRHNVATALMAARTALRDARALDSGLLAQLDAAQRQWAVSIARIADGDVDNGAVDWERASLGFRLRRALYLDSHATVTTLRLMVGCLISGSVAVVAGLGRPDWAIYATVLILNQGLDRVRGVVRSLHRLVGTLGGVLFFAALHQLAPTGLALIGVLLVLQFVVELFVARNYGIAVFFITPLALLIGDSAHPHGSITTLVGERVVETIVGVAVATVCFWVTFPRAHRRILLWTDRRVLESARECDVRQLGELHFEIAGSMRAGIDAMFNEREWTIAQWPRHAAIDDLGFRVLALGTVAPALMAELRAEAERLRA